MNEKINWVLEQHSSTNHMYDTYLPYEFHLRMVAHVAKENIHHINAGELIKESVILAAWGHDLIEDTRVSYNDVKDKLGYNAAEIIYAVSNEKGKNRKERASEKYYEGIRNTPGAVFVKLCDRIANVQYSKMTGSRMFEMYKKENDNFGRQLGFIGTDGVTVHYPGQECYKLFMQLVELFKNN